MDFSDSIFKTKSTSSVSNDNMSHTNLVMACRWGWTSNPDPNLTGANTSFATSSTHQQPLTSTYNNVRTKRFAPCQGRLYHQLICSHRIRTDLVEDCGINCVEPYGDAIDVAFICNECIQAEAVRVWESREAQHNATYPPMEQMTKEQYDQWYQEHRLLEAEFARDQRGYEMDLKAKTRPSNICSTLEASKEEMEFATELDSLSLSLMTSNTSVTGQDPVQPQTRSRASLATDASEQLHWDLNALALDRGSCGVEFSASQQGTGVPALQRMGEDELWRKPRERQT